MRALYCAALRQRLKPWEFWQFTLGELFVYLKAQEEEDELAWIRTSHVLAQQHNIHRSKRAKAVEWSDFNPYHHRRRKATPAPTFTEADDNLFRKMGNLMANGTQRNP